MNNRTVQFGLAAAAVVLVAILGIRFLPGANVGGPEPTPTATPTPTPRDISPIGAKLTPGTYQAADSFGFPVTLTIPAGWIAYSVTQDQVVFYKPNANDTAESYLLFDVVANVYPDPCQGVPQSPPLGPSVDELVSALTSMVGFQAGSVSDVTVGGVAGKAFDVDTSIAASTAGCPEILQIWDTAGGGGRLQINHFAPHLRFWIGDVHETRLAIFINALEPALQRDDRQEIQQILDTVHFE